MREDPPRTERRHVLVGVAGAGAAAVIAGVSGTRALAAARRRARDPDLGPNVVIVDRPSQAEYMAGKTRGWAAHKVADHIENHQAIGLGVCANFTADSSIVLESAIEAPRRPSVRFAHMTTISLGGGKGTIEHLVNDVAAAARPGAIRQTLLRYPAPRS